MLKFNWAKAHAPLALSGPCAGRTNGFKPYKERAGLDLCKERFCLDWLGLRLEPRLGWTRDRD
jgi:hypothetical protein